MGSNRLFPITPASNILNDFQQRLFNSTSLGQPPLLPSWEKVAEGRMRGISTARAAGYAPPHPPLRGTFSHEGRRGEVAGLPVVRIFDAGLILQPGTWEGGADASEYMGSDRGDDRLPRSPGGRQRR